MSDSLQQSMRGLSLQSSSRQMYSPPRQSSNGSETGSMRSPLHEQLFAQPAETSAAARFERFFPTSPSSATATNQHSANNVSGSFGRAPGSTSSQSGSSNAVRKAPSRAALPSQWTSHDAVPPSSSYQDLQTNGPTLVAPDDDVIPTAIVVKNIPFSVKREQLLQIIEDLQIPMPYAFNYHCDQGVFRGLAFANFKDPEEADQVVAALNGFDVNGRKLRVEYKKVLQAGEKERIEKDKAIKRMQSMQLEKERERARQQDEYASNAYLMPGYPGQFATPDPYVAVAPTDGPLLRSISSSSRLSANTDANGSKREELDLNDASTLEIYSRVLLFKDDRMRDELSFSRSLTPMERRTVHLVAQKLGLYHYSSGEGDERCVIVTKNQVPAQNRPVRSQAGSIGRSQRPSGEMLSPGSAATTGRAGLRMKKSAPQIMYDASDNGYSSSNYTGGYTGSVNARTSNANLRDGYSATMGRRPQPGGVGGAAGLQSLFASQFDVPPVPSLPSASVDSLNYHSPPQHANNLVRQPRGPPTPNGTVDPRNFAIRSRISTARSSTPSHSAPNDNGSPTRFDGRYLPTTLTDSDVTTHSTLEM